MDLDKTHKSHKITCLPWMTRRSTTTIAATRQMRLDSKPILLHKPTHSQAYICQALFIPNWNRSKSNRLCVEPIIESNLDRIIGSYGTRLFSWEICLHVSRLSLWTRLNSAEAFSEPIKKRRAFQDGLEGGELERSAGQHRLEKVCSRKVRNKWFVFRQAVKRRMVSVAKAETPAG